MTRGGPLDCLLGTMTLGSLLLAAPSFGAEVFPKRLCENLPEAHPEVKTWVVQAAPELARLPVRELGEKAALETIGRASTSGWGNIDFFTHEVFREPCTFYLSRETLRSIDAAFDLDLLTPVRGKDKTGQDFEMAAVLAGRGKLLLLYDRDGIVYGNERENRDFKLGSRVEFDTPAPERPWSSGSDPAAGLGENPLHREGGQDARGAGRHIHLGVPPEADRDSARRHDQRTLELLPRYGSAGR
jgi:hypothetical protein